MCRLILFLSLLIHCGAVSAAEQSKSKPARSCRILFLSAAQNAPDSIYLNDGTTTQLVELPSLNLSKVYALAPGDITLKLAPAPPAEGKPLPAGCPSKPLPGTITDCYLLVVSDPSNAITPLRFQVINANPEGFHTGQMMWINLTPYPVGGQLGSRTLDLKPNSQLIVEPPSDKSGFYPVRIGYSPGKDRKPAMIVSTEWTHNPAGRQVVFVMMLQNGKIPTIKGYSDLRDPADS